VEHDGHAVGVVPQVDELVVLVAVVGVDRDKAGLERREHRLDVLGAVVEVLRDLVLLGHADVEQRLRHAVGSAVELPPRDPPVALDLARGVGDLPGDDLPDIGKVPA
jgi:hypothetical protein